MAAEGVEIRVLDEEVMATLDRIERVADRPLAIMQAISGYLVTTTQRHFETETGPDGKWRPLSPRTAAKRIGRRQRGASNILRVSNRLYSSITGEATNTSAAAGTNLVYAAIQQLGGTIQMPAREQEINLGPSNRGRRFVKASAKRRETRRVAVGPYEIRIPARPYLYLTDQDREEIVEIAANGLRQEAGL